MDRELLEALIALGDAARTAFVKAKKAGREDLVPMLRKLGWTTADLIARGARDQSEDMAS